MTLSTKRPRRDQFAPPLPMSVDATPRRTAAPALAWCGRRRTLTIATLAAMAGWAMSSAGASLLVAGSAVFLAAVAADSRAEADARRRRSAAEALAEETDPARLLNRLREASWELEATRARLATTTAGLSVVAESAVRTEENVRAMLVGDLHDTVSQTLVAAQFALDDADRERAAELLASAETQLRAVMHDQRPLPEAADTSLGLQVAALLERLRTDHGMRVEVTWPAVDAAVTYPQAMVMYRFIGEALHNVVKHGGTDRAHLLIEVSRDTMVVRVSDRGRGFDVGALTHTSRLGLALLRRRCAIVGGIVDVASAPGAGTTLTLVIPRASGESPTPASG